MANKSNTANQTISIPQGGGALRGIGETFSPDLHTGTGNFTVPLATPPGRNGFQPQLNLIYSTGNGNGPYGWGWSLTIPGVSRKTSKGIPRYQNAVGSRHEGDRFILSEAEDLIAVAETVGIIRYRPRTEGLFARIEHHVTPKTDHWEVRSKDGSGQRVRNAVHLAWTTRPPSPIRRIEARSSVGKLTEDSRSLRQHHPATSMKGIPATPSDHLLGSALSQADSATQTTPSKRRWHGDREVPDLGHVHL